MSTRSKSSSNNNKRKPLGKVVGGVYVVNAKKTAEFGGKRKVPRRRRRDQGGWRRTVIGGADPWVRTAFQAVLPSAAHGPGDPRRKSRLLGHIVDGALGYATDLVHHIPIVGPLIGHPCRWVCRMVRGLEDASNSVTGTVGIHLFVLALLSCMLPQTSGFVPLTNCCNSSQVGYCSEQTCLHDTGCVICTVEGGRTICWEPAGPMVSHHPNYTGVDEWLAHHIDFVSGVIYACDLASMHEVCGVAAVMSRLAMDWMPSSVILNTTGDCYLLVDSGVAPGLIGFFDWVSREVSAITATVDFLFKIPSAVAYAFGQRHFVTIAAICGLALNGNVVKAIALAVLYVEAAVAAPVSNGTGSLFYAYRDVTDLECSPLVQPPPCPLFFYDHNITAIWCFNPPMGHIYRPDTVRSNQSIPLLTEYATMNRKAFGGWGCVVRWQNDSQACCSLRKVPDFCRGCASDCSWMDRRMTYERCGTTPWLSTACWPYDPENRTCSALRVAWISMRGWQPLDLMPQGEMYISSGKWFHYTYNTTALAMLPPAHWARLPGSPRLYRGSWYWVPRGFYSDYRDLSTGLISKDAKHQNYQVAYSATGAFQIAGVTVHIVLVAVLAALGARWTLFLVALWLWLPSFADAIPTSYVAATAAAQFEEAWVRATIFVLVLKWRKLSPLLAGHPVWLCILAYQVVMVDALHLQDIAVACFFSGLVTVWLGAASTVLPFLMLTHSYIRHRFEAWAYAHSDRSILFLAVILVPKAVSVCAAYFWLFYLTWLGLAQGLVFLLAPRSKLGLHKTIGWLSRQSRRVLRLARPLVIWAAAERGVYWYEHLDGKLEYDCEYRDPYFPLRTQIIEVEDAGRMLACGDAIKGHPVFCRAGTKVRAGIGQLARGWTRNAPFSVKTVTHRGDLKCLGLSVIGSDSAVHNGSIVIMGSAMRSWMGFGYGGCLLTCYHGARGRHIALKEGALPPISHDKTRDIVRYPLPQGLQCLEPCECALQTAYLVTRFGNLIGITCSGGKFINTTPLTLREAKGSSGAPVICKCGKVKGMMVSVRSSRGAVSSINLVTLSSTDTEETSPHEGWSADYPVVPKKDKEVKHLVAPTGSGKSTKLPMHYYRAGYRVLVLNPSVATTMSMGPYIKAAYGLTPNVICGDTKAMTGCRLTYSTYGMFLATGGKIEADVIICDECHSTDATTVLGIGTALHAFEDSPKGKLLILATATPPGTPITPHPDITQIQLDDKGDIPFHGKKIPLDRLRKGRHLIFQASKKHCEELAKTLQDHGVKAVYYYRGRPVSVIPTSGDVVVVATDALMTGYTGNFDSVYDCCLTVEAKLEVDMAPTFSVDVVTVPADTVCRMQRRGRTGRGAPGIYYYVASGAAANGVVPTAAVYEAFDSGLAYFGMTTAEVATALDFYREQSITPSFLCNLGEVQAVFDTLGYVPHAQVARMKNRVENYVYLHAAQYEVAQQSKAQAPSDDPRWKGLNGSNPFPLLFNLTKTDPAKVTSCELANKITACYEEFYASYSVTFAGVGLAVAACYMAVDMFGNIVIKRVFTLTQDSTATHSVPTPDLFDGETEECHLDVIADMALQMKDMLGRAAASMAVTLGHQPDPLVFARAFVPHILAAIQYFAGLTTMSDAPALGCVLGFVGGMLSPLPLKCNLFLTCLGGAFASRLTGQRGAAAFAVAGGLGAMLSATSLVGLAGEIFSVYSSTTATALVVLKLIDGQMPTFSEWTSLLFNLTSPGGMLVGAAAAALIGFVTKAENNVWMNRLLSMLNRGTTCDEYFVAVTTLRQKVITLLEKCNIWEIFRTLAGWLNDPEDDLCSPRSVFYDYLEHIGRLMRIIVEFARSVCRSITQVPGMPIFSCTRAYRGPWRGSGVVRVICECGAEGTWLVEEGKAKKINVPKRCSAYWSRGVPINNTFSGSAAPAPCGWSTMAVNNGFDSYVVYEKRGDDVWVTKVSNPDQVIECHCPELVSAVMVDGVQIKCLGGTGWEQAGAYRVRLRTVDGIKEAKLPLNLSDYKLKEGTVKTNPVTTPPEVLRPVQLTARAVNLETVKSDAESVDSVEAYRQKSRAMRKSGMDQLDQALERPRRRGSFDDTIAMLKATKFELPPCKPSDPDRTSLSKAMENPVEMPPPATQLRRRKYIDDGLDVAKLRQMSKHLNIGNEVRKQNGLPAVDDLDPKSSSSSSNITFEEFSSTSVATIESTNTGPSSEPTKGVKETSESEWTTTTNSSEMPCAARIRLKPAAPVRPVKVRQKFSGTLPKVKPTEPDAYSLASSSWTDCSDQDQECSLSYLWDLGDSVYRTGQRAASAVRTLTHGMMRVRPLAYVTTPESLKDRAVKVTTRRSREVIPALQRQYNKAMKRALELSLREWSLDEALAHTANKTAKSAVTGATAATLKSGNTKVVQEIYDNLGMGKIEEPWNQVNIMPKQEVFVKTPKKPTKKPARIIAYPHLEMRVAEKMVLGEIAPAVVKAVCGEAYGFQYTPKQRVNRLLEMWKSKSEPIGFTCDTVCFDSTITPEDMDWECNLYSAATPNNFTKIRIKALHERLYKSGPMMMQGKYCGIRNCRASGVFTTSSSNTMTCFMKVNAAAEVAGLKNPSWLVNGDDCVCISESRGPDIDQKAMEIFALAMKQMGAPQGEVPKPLYSLELLDSCSSNVSVAQTSKGQYHYLTRDPSIPLARASVEGKRFNPLGTWLGYILANYPAIWVSRILCVQFLANLMTQDDVSEITFEWYGNNYTVPLESIPYIIQALHGQQCWDILQYTPREVNRVGQALNDITMKPLRYWKRLARSVLASCRRRKGILRFLGNTLLCWVHHDKVKLDQRLVAKATEFNPFDPHRCDERIDVFKHRPVSLKRMLLFFALGILGGYAAWLLAS